MIACALMLGKVHVGFLLRLRFEIGFRLRLVVRDTCRLSLTC